MWMVGTWDLTSLEGRERARDEIEQVLFQSAGSTHRAADRLGVSYPYLHWALRQLGMRKRSTQIRARWRALWSAA